MINTFNSRNPNSALENLPADAHGHYPEHVSADSYHSSQRASENFADLEKPPLMPNPYDLSLRPPAREAPFSVRLGERIHGVFVKKQVFTYVHKAALKVDTRRLLSVALLFYFLEYCAIFAFQLISYLTLKRQWKDSTYVTGLVLLLVYIPVCVMMMALVNTQRRYLAYGLKVVEFGIHFVLLGWAVAYLDFSLMALSYIIMLDILVLLLFVR